MDGNCGEVLSVSIGYVDRESHLIYSLNAHKGVSLRVCLHEANPISLVVERGDGELHGLQETEAHLKVSIRLLDWMSVVLHIYLYPFVAKYHQ